jgi:hypothetical protein
MNMVTSCFVSAIVKSAKSRAAYFAERIHESIAGMGTKDDDLIFLIVSRADVDLESVKQEYAKMYGKSMADDVAVSFLWLIVLLFEVNPPWGSELNVSQCFFFQGDTGGDYKKMLLALMGL